MFDFDWISNKYYWLWKSFTIWVEGKLLHNRQKKLKHHHHHMMLHYVILHVKTIKTTLKEKSTCFSLIHRRMNKSWQYENTFPWIFSVLKQSFKFSILYIKQSGQKNLQNQRSTYYMYICKSKLRDGWWTWWCGCVAVLKIFMWCRVEVKYIPGAQKTMVYNNCINKISRCQYSGKTNMGCHAAGWRVTKLLVRY